MSLITDIECADYMSLLNRASLTDFSAGMVLRLLASGTPAPGGSQYGLAQDNTYIYTGGSSGITYKYRKSDMVKIDQTTIAYGGTIHDIAQDSTWLYVGGSTTNKIVRYNKATMNYSSIGPDTGGPIERIVLESPYLYV